MLSATLHLFEDIESCLSVPFFGMSGGVTECQEIIAFATITPPGILKENIANRRRAANLRFSLPASYKSICGVHSFHFTEKKTKSKMRAEHNADFLH